MERHQAIGRVHGARRRAGLAALLAAAMVAAACGGDDGGSSGVDGDKRLDELSQEEATDFCEWGLSLLDGDEVTRFGCYLTALVFSPDAETCEIVAQECIDEAEPIDPAEAECEFEEDLPPCASEVTVAEMEDCARDAVGVLAALADDITCDSDPEELEDLSLEQPASCLAIEEKCPELFEEEDDEEGGGEAGTAGSRAGPRWLRGASRAARASGVALPGR